MRPLITPQPVNNTTPDYRLPFNTQESQWHSIATGSVLDVTVPWQATVVRIFASAPIICSPDTISSFPALGAPELGTFELNPAVLSVKTLSLISFYPLADGDMVLNFYSY